MIFFVITLWAVFAAIAALHRKAVKDKQFAEEMDRIIFDLTHGKVDYEFWDDFVGRTDDDIIWPDDMLDDGIIDLLDVEYEDVLCN